MRYTFRIGDRATTLRQQERDLQDDDAARIEALLFAADALRESSERIRVGNLTVEVRSSDGKLPVIVQIFSSGEHSASSPGDEMACEGEGHPS